MISCSKRLSSNKSSGSKKDQAVLGLFDSGASSNFVPRDRLKYVDHTIQPVHVRVKGRYRSTTIKERATFHVQLPEFASSKTVFVTAHVEEKIAGRHDVIFDTCSCLHKCRQVNIIRILIVETVDGFGGNGLHRSSDIVPYNCTTIEIKFQSKVVEKWCAENDIMTTCNLLFY